MANFSSVPSKSTAEFLTAADWNNYLRNNLNLGVARKLGETVLSVATATVAVTLSGDALLYRHLLVVVHARGDTAATTATLRCRVNNDSAANYYAQLLSASAATTTASEALAATSWKVGTIPAANATAGFFGVHQLLLAHYGNTSFRKSLRASGGCFSGTGTGTGIVEDTVGVVNTNNNAVSEIDLFASAGNLDAGTVVSIYGLPD